MKRLPCFVLLQILAFMLVAGGAARAQSALESDAMAGAVLFRDKGCAQCHGKGGVGTDKAPSLVNLWQDKVWTGEKITNQILNGGQKMPPFADSLTDPEIAQIVAYLRSKTKPVPPPAPAAN